MTCPVRVSVCIPTYNGEQFLAESIQSVLTQTFSEFELLIVDDGSSDRTIEIIRSFSDPRLRLYQNAERLGIPKNWNRCLTLAQGEFFCLFHQDDVMMPENLERKVHMLVSDPAISFVHSAADLIVEESAPTPLANWIEDSPTDFVADGLIYFRKLLLPDNVICAPAVMAHREVFVKLGGFDEELSFAPDYEMWLKASVVGRVGFLSTPLIRYRWHERNASHFYRFERGVEECILAGNRALLFYRERSGRSEESALLQEAFDAVARMKHWALELEKGKAWLEGQVENWRSLAEKREEMLGEQRAWIDELKQGKKWSDEQARRWQMIAEESDRLLCEQKDWISKLEQGKKWSDEQARHWQMVAEESDRLLREQKDWISKLEQGNMWLDEQRRYWQTEADRYRNSAWGRLGKRLGTVKPSEQSAKDTDE